MPPRVQNDPPKLSSRQQTIAKLKPVKPIVLLTKSEKDVYCLKDDSTIDEKLLMLGAASIADNLHDFAGSRSSLTPKQIDTIVKKYLELLEKAKNQPMKDETRNKIYSRILYIIKNTEYGIDKAFKDIYHEYFDSNLTEPELDWSSLSSSDNGIMDNFEVIIGNKKALIDLYKRNQPNLFLETLRKIVQRNETFKDKNINFVIDVSTIGNDIFVDSNSEIYKGTAGFFDDFHQPKIHSSNYHNEELEFTVNIQNIISDEGETNVNPRKCILNHIALDNFQIINDKIYWNSKYLKDTKVREIKISETIPSEFGVSKYSELIDASVKKNPNTVQKMLLARFQEITGLPSSLTSVDYGKHVFDFKRLMDSSQIMYTYYLNKKHASDGKRFIFVTHDNMAAVIARLIGVPCIQTHIYSHIRTVSVHLGTDNYIRQETIATIHDRIFESVKNACVHVTNLPGYTPLVMPTLSSGFNKYLNDKLTKITPNYSKILNHLITVQHSLLNQSDFSLILIFKLILNIYISFLNNAKEQLNKYISKLSENINYNNFKQLKDNNDILNVNYTPETLEIDYNYIKSLIDNLNKFEYKESNGTSIYKQFYEIIKQDNGYMFSTIDFKMLIVCLIYGVEKDSLKDTMDFYTDSYDKIEITTNRDKNRDAFNYFKSNKHSLKRYFNQISELQKQYPTLLTGGGYDNIYGRYSLDSKITENVITEDLIKANLVKEFFESIYKKQDLRDYYQTVSKPFSTPEEIIIAQKAKNQLIVQIENEKLEQLKVQQQAQLLSQVQQQQAQLVQKEKRERSFSQVDETQKRIRFNNIPEFAPPTPMRISGGNDERFSFFKEFQNKLKL